MKRDDSQSRLLDVWQNLQPELARLAAALGAGTSLADVTAADVLQDVYLQATRQTLTTFSNDELRRWLFRVTVNRCKLEGRKQNRWRKVWRTLLGTSTKPSTTYAESSPLPTINNTPPVSETSPTVNSAIQQEHKQLIHNALDEMPDDLRTVLVLRYFHEENSREIAAILETSDSTIRGRLRTARQLLAAALNAKGIHE